jgi:ubiquinol-cytochrome c reductase cytochrome c subunit
VIRLAVAAVLAAVALLSLAGATVQGQPQPNGEVLFRRGCSSCHGQDLRGIPGRGPNLRGVGAAAADFYVRTGRMPLRDPEDEPVRTQSPYTAAEQAAIIAYVASFGGPRIPRVDPARGDLADGFRLFTENCMSCHQVVAQGGITTSGVAPRLQEANPTDVGEAIRTGPYVMPQFPQLTQQNIDSIARYVNYTKDPEDIGGWGIGHIGPIPEGMVAWLLGGMALFLIIRVIGERTSE